MNNHRKIYRITGRAILDVMKMDGSVPMDIEYVDSCYYPDEEVFGVKVEHHSFPMIPEGTPITKENLEFEYNIEHLIEAYKNLENKV